MTDVLTAVNDFLLRFVNAPQDIIVRGYQNLYALPQEDDYILIANDYAKRVGTNIHDYTDTLQVERALHEYVVTIDFCNRSEDTAYDMANTIEVISRSRLPCEFFKDYDIEFLYCEDIKNLPFVNKENQYIYRYRVTIHLSAWETYSQNAESAIHADVYIENVDVHHKP